MNKYWYFSKLSCRTPAYAGTDKPSAFKIRALTSDAKSGRSTLLGTRCTTLQGQGPRAIRLALRLGVSEITRTNSVAGGA